MKKKIADAVTSEVMRTTNSQSGTSSSVSTTNSWECKFNSATDLISFISRLEQELQDFRKIYQNRIDSSYQSGEMMAEDYADFTSNNLDITSSLIEKCRESLIDDIVAMKRIRDRLDR